MHWIRRRAGRLIVVCGGAILAAGQVDGQTPSGSPKAVVVWPAGPMEVRVAFDRAVPPGIERALVGKAIRVDESTGKLDVQQAPGARPIPSQGGPRVAAACLEDDGRLLVLATDPHARPAAYWLSLPSLGSSGAPQRRPDQDVTYDLSGVEASWDSGVENAKPAWTGWWPDLSPDVTRDATRGSIEHERGLALLTKPGRLTLRTLLGLPRGKPTLRIVSSQPIVEAIVGGENAEPRRGPTGESVVERPLEATGDPLDLALVVRTGEGGQPVALKVTYQYESKSPQPVLRRLLAVPWAPAPPPVPSAPAAPPDFVGGDAKRGEAVFFGPTAKCANCHQIGGKGGNVGPGLTAVFERPAAEVYRDVAEPSAIIQTEYVPYTVALKDGRVVAGIVRAEGAVAIRLTDTEAKVAVIPRSEIEELRPSATSVMPVGLVGAIGEAAMRDLMAFLMKPKK